MAGYSAMQSFAVCLARHDVGIEAGPATWDEVAGVASRLPLTDACFGLSLVSQFAAHPKGLMAAQTDVAALLEPTALQAAVRQRLKGPAKTALIFPMQLVAAWRELALHGNPTAEGSFGDPATAELFWQWLMMITEALAEDEAKRLEHAEPSITGDFALSITATGSYLSARDTPGLLVARHYELLDRTLQSPEIRKSDNWVDLEADIGNLVGCDWRTFHAIGCAMALPAVAGRSPDDLQRWAAIVPDSFFPPSVDRDLMWRVVRQVSSDLPLLRARYEELGTDVHGLPDPLPLQELPLIDLRDGRFCPSIPQFLVERFTLGMYHLLWNAWRERTGKPRNQFTAFWGELLERYVDSLFLPLFPHSGTFKRLWLDEELLYDGSRPSDILLDCGEVLVLVEVTHSGLTRQSLVAGDPDKIREDIAKALIAKSQQLESVVRDFQDGRFSLGERTASSFRRFLPVVVVWQNVPIFWPTSEYFYSELESNGILQDAGIMPPRLLVMDECEGVLSAVHAGEAFLDAIGDPGWRIRNESFTNFRHRIGHPLFAVRHPVLGQAAQRLMDSIKTVFSG